MSLKSGAEKSKNTNNSSEEYQINKSLFKKITQILEIVLLENKKSNNYKDKLISQKNMCFSSSCIPSIDLKKYLERIIIYTESEDSTIIIAFIYIDRLSKFSGIILTPYNIHRIIFVAILIAIKYNEDNTFTFEFYSQVAGISINELKILEFEFVCLLKFKLFVSKKDYEKYKVYIDEIED